MAWFESDKEKQKQLIDKQLEADKSLSEFTFNQNMQALENERNYNNPKNQLDRLRSAGLNPLYFGLDGNSSNGAPFSMQTPSVDVGNIASAVQAQNANLQAAFGQALTASKNVAEIEQMKHQNMLLDAQTKRANAETRNFEIDADWKPSRYGSELAVNGSIIKVNESEVPKNMTLADYQRQLKNESEQNVRNLQAKYDETQASIKEIESQANLNVAKRAEAYSQVDLNKALGLSARSSAAYTDQLRETEFANTQSAWEKVYQDQLHSGYLAAQIQQEFRLKDKSGKEMDAHIRNLNALSRLYGNQAEATKVEMTIHGMQVGILKDENGHIQIDAPKVLAQSEFNYIYGYVDKAQNVLQNVAEYGKTNSETFSNVVQSVIPLKFGTTPLKATKGFDYKSKPVFNGKKYERAKGRR